MSNRTQYIFTFVVAFSITLFLMNLNAPRSGMGSAQALQEIAPSAGEDIKIEREVSSQEETTPPPRFERRRNTDFQVQAVLSAGKGLLISAPIDGKIKSLPFKNGDVFKKGKTLVRYECTAERAKVNEINARLSISKRQLEAYERLKAMDMVADVEYVSILGQNKQDRALLTQARARLNMCSIQAPFNGRVQDIQVDVNEVVKSGRFLMKINSNEPLNVEMLVPSVWLRWLNIGTSLEVYIKESDRNYSATIERIHGEVDPVSQSIRVVAKIDEYKEELLPGMSGQATFEGSVRDISSGFMGLSTSVYNGGN